MNEKRIPSPSDPNNPLLKIAEKLAKQREDCQQKGHVWVGVGDEGRSVCDDCGIDKPIGVQVKILKVRMVDVPKGSSFGSPPKRTYSSMVIIRESKRDEFWSLFEDWDDYVAEVEFTTMLDTELEQLGEHEGW